MGRTLWNECQKAASVLDKKCPGWADKVNLKSFDMTICDHCVLGQGCDLDDYGTQRKFYSEHNLDGTAFGWMDFTVFSPGDIEKLEGYWTTLIKQRTNK